MKNSKNQNSIILTWRLTDQLIQIEHSGRNFDIDSQMIDGYNAKVTEIVNSHREKQA